jgi:hypothetical protein
MLLSSCCVEECVACSAAVATTNLCCPHPGGCRWVFLGEGIPSVALALALPWLLPAGPGSSSRAARHMLSPADMQLLAGDVSL